MAFRGGVQRVQSSRRPWRSLKKTCGDTRRETGERGAHLSLDRSAGSIFRPALLLRWDHGVGFGSNDVSCFQVWFLGEKTKQNKTFRVILRSLFHLTL